MRNGLAPAARTWLQTELCAPAATHMHTWQKSADKPLPPNKASLCPLCPPCRHPTAVRAPTRAGFRAPRVGTKTSRCVEPPSRWSSQIDASVTTASGVDLWTRESGSARSRAYARLRWGLRGSITRSPNGFAPGPSTPSRCIRHAIGIRTDGLWQCRRGPALGGPGCCNFAFSTTRAPVRLFLPSKLSHPLIYEWVGPNRGAEGVKHTLSSLGSAPQAQEGPTPRPRMRPRCSHSEADRTACSQAVRPAVAFACGIRSSRWLRCFSQSPVARGRRAR